MLKRLDGTQWALIGIFIGLPALRLIYCILTGAPYEWSLFF